MKTQIKTGPPVEGNDFFGREKEINYAWDLINRGISLMLAAPRRVGKSSFAKKMLTKAAGANWKYLYIDLEEVRNEEEFIRLFIEKIQEESWWQKAKASISDNTLKILKSIQEIEILGTSVSLDTHAWKRNIYSQLKKLIEETGEILIVVDELTIFLNSLLKKENGKENVEFFLNWLRSLRQITKTKARWIFCSSVSIQNFVNTHCLSHTLNDVKSFPIDEFTSTEAKNFIKNLDIPENIVFTDKHISYILKKLSWKLPFFIQILIEKTISLIVLNAQILSENTINKAYQTIITETHFDTWHQRLNDYSENKDHAKAVLKILSQNHKGESRDNLFNILYGRINDTDKCEEITSALLSMLKMMDILCQRMPSIISGHLS